MDPNGDISDTFDDSEDLTRSVEQGHKGPWNDESAVFEDARLKELQEKISAKPQPTDYQTRRLRELQERGLKAKKAKQATPTDADLFADAGPASSQANGDWGENTEWQGEAKPDPVTWGDRRRSEQDPASQDDNPIVFARRASDRVEAPPEELESELEPAEAQAEQVSLQSRQAAMFVSSLLGATLMLTGVAFVHGVLDSWSGNLAARAGATALLTGILWHKFQSDRLRAMAIGTGCYLALFAPSARVGEQENLLALVVGLIIVIAGSGLIGPQRDPFGAPSRK